jgi:hypothetical protein
MKYTAKGCAYTCFRTLSDTCEWVTHYRVRRSKECWDKTRALYRDACIRAIGLSLPESRKVMRRVRKYFTVAGGR